MSSHEQRVANIRNVLEWCHKHQITYKTPCAYDRIYRAIMTSFHYTPNVCAEYARDILQTLQMEMKK